MSVKSAALLAFVGAVLAAALLLMSFIRDILNVSRGLVPAATVFSAFVYAFAAVGVAVFLFVFQRSGR